MLVTVARTEMAPEAHILRGRLEAEGIPAFIQHEHHVTMDWLVSNALGGVRLQVPVEYAQEAIAILRTLNEGGFALTAQLVEDLPVDGQPESESETANCPGCGGDGVATTGTARGIALAFLFLIALPTPWRRQHWRCTACSKTWSTRSRAPYGMATGMLGGLMMLATAALAVWLLIVLASQLVGGLCGSTQLCGKPALMAHVGSAVGTTSTIAEIAQYTSRR